MRLWPRDLPSSAEMRSYDQNQISLGTSSLELMQRAGDGVFQVLSGTDRVSGIAILCGSGNNGGDGLVLARLLLQSGVSAPLVCISPSARYSDDFLVQFEKFSKALAESPSNKEGLLFLLQGEASQNILSNLPIISLEELHKILSRSTAVVDALLGTGSKGAPKGGLGEMIQLVAKLKAERNKKLYTLSIDIPSGIDPDTGEVPGAVISADLTVAIQAVKRGMLQYPARQHCGEIEVIDIGIGCKPASKFQLLNEESVPRLPCREAAAHKHKFGDLLVIGGSESMPGAPILSSYAALQFGAGVVRVAALRGVQYPEIPAEIMRVPVGQNERKFSRSHLTELRHYIDQASLLLIGPGMGSDDATRALLSEILAIRGSVPLVLDADGLNLLSIDKQVNLKNAVLTPHPGELAKLLGVSTAEVQRDRYSSAEKLSEKTGAVVVLKGAATVVYSGSAGRGWVLDYANPFLATAGSGDVLAGIIASAICQGVGLEAGACLGVFTHAHAAELATHNKTRPIIASQLISALRECFGSFQKH